MANKKINCPVCRRSYDNSIEYCPYCSTPNPLMTSNIEMDDKKLADKTQKEKAKPAKKIIPAETHEDEIDEYDTEDEYTPAEEDGFYSDDEVYEYHDDEDSFEEQYYDDEQADDENYEYEDEDDSEYEYYEEDDEENNNDYESDESSSQLINDTKRSRIDWSDEETPEAPDMTNAFNEKGEYQPNFDGYYNDTKAKIEGEIENLTQGKEKAIIRAILGVAAVAGVIVYLVLTLY